MRIKRFIDPLGSTRYQRHELGSEDQSLLRSLKYKNSFEQVFHYFRIASYWKEISAFP